MSELDTDTAIRRRDDGALEATITDRWSIGSAPNGGYLAVIATRAILDALPQPHPFSVTTHFLSVARPGPAELHVEVVREGKGHSTGMARMLQGGREVLRTLAVLGDLAALKGPTHVTRTPPELPPIEACDRRRAGPVAQISIADRVDVGVAPGDVSWTPGAPDDVSTRSDRAELRAWARLRDGTEPDPLSLLLFADAMPPPSLNLRASVGTPWVPTLELTVHVRALPAPGWLRTRFTTSALIGGYLEEDGELYDSRGMLVAQSRQLARLHRG